jgi:hypothetical protein
MEALDRAAVAVIERVITGLVVAAIALSLLAAYLPRVFPYVAAVAVIGIVARLAWFYTGGRW